MRIVVLANELQKVALSNGNSFPGIIWINDEAEFLQHRDADGFIDLQFVNDVGRKNLLVQLLPQPVIVNSVADTLAEINPSLVRINGWNTFLSSPLIEGACDDETTQKKVEAIFSVFGMSIEWLPDDPGFVTARVVSMIINEAFLSLGEGVSTKDEINTAMKLGTAYPYGPFEWAEKIGVQHVVGLLQKLSKIQPHYTPAELLVQEAKAI